MSFLSLLLIHIKFRIRQIIRILTNNAKAGLSFFLFIIIIMIVKLPSDYFSFLFLFPTLIFHLGRKDINFLKKVFYKKWRLIILIENFLICFFLTLININYRYNSSSIAYLLIVILFSFFIVNSKKKTIIEWKVLPYSLFEWKSYLRRNTLLTFLCYPFILASAYENSTLIIGGLFILDPISHLFKYNESKEMFEMYFTRISLKEKIKNNLLFFNIILTPLYVLFIVLNINNFYVLIYYIAFMNLYYLLIITRKYSLYSHDKEITEYYMGTYFENLVLSMSIIPALFSIKKNIELSDLKIKKYVRNPKY